MTSVVVSGGLGKLEMLVYFIALTLTCKLKQMKKTNPQQQNKQNCNLLVSLKKVELKPLQRKVITIKVHMINRRSFYKIMHLPEYYVTRSEHEIFKTQSETIIEALQQTRHLF
jgi:hypothetical protein